MGFHSRRMFLFGSLGAGVLLGNLGAGAETTHESTAHNNKDLDDYIEGQRRALQIPGLAACIVKEGRVVWAKGYGWANISKRISMDPGHTIQNIGSISKTIVTTAVMQLWEKGKFQLDDDVSEHLQFSVRNPIYPNIPITYRQLLTHSSSIDDSMAYQTSYACGDPKLSLEIWLKEYFTVGGRFYSKEANFHPWKPGEKNAYSNTGFGLLGYLVERISGEPLSQYTKKHIFEPLEMKRTGWFLSEIDTAAHAVPYVPDVKAGSIVEELDVYRRLGFLGSNLEKDPRSGDYWPLCLYSFPNFPDGALRTSVNQLARFLLAYMNNGALGKTRILAADTVRLMLTPQSATSSRQGLCWVNEQRNGQRHWGHNGADPGIRTTMSFRMTDNIGVITFVNRGSGIDLSSVNARLFQEAARF
ncbi:MAG: Beta-lactamase [Chthonomonadaceae bacterium]|nr:Beta-lactamase [Chthonomonadaceae bacterium]